jgi:hypothetical protein
MESMDPKGEQRTIVDCRPIIFVATIPNLFASSDPFEKSTSTQSDFKFLP